MQDLDSNYPPPIETLGPPPEIKQDAIPFDAPPLQPGLSMMTTFGIRGGPI